MPEKDKFISLANVITGIRIIASLAMFFCPVFSPGFYAAYVLAGFSDVADGIVARKTNTASPFGARFDTLADLIMVIVCLYKLLPVLYVPAWLCIWISIIAVIKIFNIVYGYVANNCFLAVHTFANKVTGVLLFLSPFTLSFIDFRYTAAVICTVATFAAVQEGHYIRIGKNYR